VEVSLKLSIISILPKSSIKKEIWGTRDGFSLNPSLSRSQ
jgi:hypothetical protein